MQPLIVSYYNENSVYEKEATELAESCKNFGLEYEIGAIHEEPCLKPTFLLAALEKFNRPLIWTDIDSIFVQDPILLKECKADVAFRINDNVPIDSPLKMLTSTMFINNTLSAKKLLSFWKKECEKLLKQDSNALDQVALRKVVLHYPTIVEIKRLPMTYVTVTDNAEDRLAYPDNAVIVHHELSRIYNSEPVSV